MTSNQPPNQQPAKLNVNNSGPVGASGENMNNRNNQNKLMFNRNTSSAMSVASAIQKNVNTTGTFILKSENIKIPFMWPQMKAFKRKFKMYVT